MGWIKRHWLALLGLLAWLQPLWLAIKWLVGRGGDLDFIISRWADPGWVGAVISFFLSPPPWTMLPLLIIGTALILWDYSRHRNVAGPSVAPLKLVPDDEIYSPKVTRGPAPLLAGLYLADIDVSLKAVQSDHHGEINIRLFNGSTERRTFDLVGVSGHITFKAGNLISSDPKMNGELPQPTISPATVRSGSPQTEWSLILDQRFPSKEAPKVADILRAHPLVFDFTNLDIQIAWRDDPTKVERLTLWGGISYNRASQGAKSRIVAAAGKA
jgi:hypothetical protein